jgi:UPF0042 nucleotide-binding protein
VFILPGGPPSNLMGFLQISLPGLHKLSGLQSTGLPQANVRLATELTGQRGGISQRTAVGIDARNQSDDLRQLPELVKQMQQSGIRCEIVFLEAQDDTLIRRYSETRRKHPLTDEERPLAEAIQLERTLMEPFLRDADLRLDTTHTNPHELREIIRNRLGEKQEQEISLLLESFGYKHGVPRDADFVFDARCLPNPHWDPKLRPYTGLDPEVCQFLEQDPRVNELRTDLVTFLDRWVPWFEKDGRNYLTIAIGCTGGQHRSVYIVERLTDHLRDSGRQVLTRHRELS